MEREGPQDAKKEKDSKATATSKRDWPARKNIWRSMNLKWERERERKREFHEVEKEVEGQSEASNFFLTMVESVRRTLKRQPAADADQAGRARPARPGLLLSCVLRPTSSSVCVYAWTDVETRVRCAFCASVFTATLPAGRVTRM